MAPIEELLADDDAAADTSTSLSTARPRVVPGDGARLRPEDLEGLNPQEIDAAYQDFLKEVDDVSQRVKDIVDGKITDFEAFDQEEQTRTAEQERKLAFARKVRELRQQEEERKQKEKLLNGRDGKGQGEDYLLFCKKCFTEFLTDSIEKCTRCGNTKLMTQAERKKELLFKLEEYKEEKAKHQVRKDKWTRWKKSQSLLGKSKVVNYKSWEYWEPDSDAEDEENMEPVLPKDDPQFKALDADMKKRNKERLERHHAAMRCKEEGNRLLQQGEYLKAIELYKEGLDKQKDLKPLWTNKALAEIKTFRYQDAVESAGKVLELCEIFEDGFEKSKDLAFKAFSRRAMGYRGLHKWKEAVEDLKEAVKLDPRNKEVRDLLAKSKEAAAEARHSDEVAKRLAAEKQKKEEFLAENGGDAGRGDSITGATGPAGDGAMKRIQIEADSSDEEDEEEKVEIREDAVAPAKETLLPAEDEEETAAASMDAAQEKTASSSSASAHEISSMSQRDFLTLLIKLEKTRDERILFCARRHGEKSRLDKLLAELETLSVRWKKNSAGAATTRAPKSGKAQPATTSKDDEENIKKIVKLLLPLCAESDFHCELCAPAARHLFPVVQVAPYEILQLMDHMSHRSASATAMVEYVVRYPEKNYMASIFRVLSVDSKENLMPPNADAVLKNPEKALQDDKHMEIMLKPAARDFVLAILCNLQLHSKKFRSVLLQEKDLIVSSIVKKLDVMNWKTAALNLLANLLANEMGSANPVFTKLSIEHCLPPLLKVTTEYSKTDGLQALLPVQIVLNMREQQKVFLAVPQSLTEDLAEVVFRTLEKAFAFQLALSDEVAPASAEKGKAGQGEINFDDEEQMKRIEAYIKLGTTVVTKVPTFQKFFLASCLKADAEQPPTQGEALSAVPDPRKTFVPNLVRLVCFLKPRGYSASEAKLMTNVEKMQSNCRGNLSVLFERLVEFENKGLIGAGKSFGLGGVVEPFIDYLRKESGAAQKNAGIVVTKLAQSEKYRQLVRNFHGFESLQQIQLGIVQKEKEKPVDRGDWKPLMR
eukprot:g17238.t1